MLVLVVTMTLILTIFNIVGKCVTSIIVFFFPWIIHGDLTKDLFGKTESRSSPPFLKGTDGLNSLHDFENVFGKKRKRKNDGLWKKGQFCN